MTLQLALPLRSVAIVSAALLAGCGGGGGGADVAISPIVRTVAYDTTVARLEDLSFSTDVPASGEATYSGYLGLTARPGGVAPVALTSEATLTARFGSGTMSGSFGKVVSSDDPGATGGGDIRNGRIAMSGITADIDGSLTVRGAPYTLDAALSAAFLGSSAEGIVGTVSGDLRTGGDRAGSVSGEAWLIAD